MKNSIIKKLITGFISLTLVVTMSGVPAFAVDVSNEITAFDELDESYYFFDGSPTVDELTAEFPSSLEVTLGGQKTKIPVSWKPLGEYDRYNHYSFVFMPNWSGEYVLNQDLNYEFDVPFIIAFRTGDGIETPVDEEEGVVLDKPVKKVAMMLNLYAYAAETTNEDKIYKFLTGDMKLNMAAACGVLANFQNESGLAPNNLENTVNKKLDMTDAEYTKAVNSGKRTKKQFCNDGGGYGLCQWTGGRRTTLYEFAKNYCSEKGISFDISNLNMQLSFFKKELTESYSATNSTLKQVSNNEIGAFAAAGTMCANFEAPSQIELTAVARGKTALSTFWDKRASTKSNYTSNYYFGLTGLQYPTAMGTSGNTMICYGYAFSNKGIAKVEVHLSGTALSSSYDYVDDRSKSTTKPTFYSFTGTKNPKTNTSVDGAMAFSKLTKPGQYTYDICITDVNGKEISISKTFSITSGGSKKTAYETVIVDPSELTITDATYPTKLTKGDAFVGEGKATSNYKITSVSAVILDSKGNKVQEVNATPEAKSYDVSQLTSKLDFTTLKGGTYKYYVYAKDAMKSKYLVSKKTFTVESKTISSETYPISFAKGKSFSIKGSVKSDVNLSQVYVRVVNSSGKVVTSKKINPKAKSYGISKLSSSIKFSSLKTGTYTYKVSATDEVSTKLLLSKKFTVYTPSTLKASSYNYPKTLKYKKSFSIKGSVKSNYKLKYVKVYVTNKSGTEVLSKTINVEGKGYKSYKISNFDKYMSFGTLKKGTYYYRVYAADSKIAKRLVNKKFTVK